MVAFGAFLGMPREEQDAAMCDVTPEQLTAFVSIATSQSHQVDDEDLLGHLLATEFARCREASVERDLPESLLAALAKDLNASAGDVHNLRQFYRGRKERVPLKGAKAFGDLMVIEIVLNLRAGGDRSRPTP